MDISSSDTSWDSSFWPTRLVIRSHQASDPTKGIVNYLYSEDPPTSEVVGSNP